jgi:hypothetical protein
MAREVGRKGVVGAVGIGSPAAGGHNIDTAAAKGVGDRM